MLSLIIRNEWRMLWQDRALLPVAALLAILIGYGIYSGTADAAFRQRSLDGINSEYATRFAKLQADLADFEAGRKQPKGFMDPRGGGAIGGVSGAPYVAMPLHPLAALATGQSDLLPYYYKISLRSKQTTLNNDEIENPVNLLAGRFDLAFVIVYLYPLLILALTYNILSSEKEQGTLALALSNPVSLSTVALGKILTRAGFFLAATVGMTLLAVMLAGVQLTAADAIPRLAMWMGIVLLYGSFWFACGVAVNALGRNSSANAMILAGVWLAFAVLLPSALHLASSSLYPVPSRVEMIQAMRNAGVEAQQRGSQKLAAFYEDHPELAPVLGGQKAPDYASLTYAAQQEVDRLVQPVLDHYDRQVASQQALVDRFSLLSPAVLTQQALADLAGTGLPAYRHFNLQADRFLKAWQDFFFPRIFKRELLTAAQLSTLPRFAYQPEPLGDVAARVSIAAMGIAAPLALAILLALRWMRRYPVAG